MSGRPDGFESRLNTDEGRADAAGFLVQAADAMRPSFEAVLRPVDTILRGGWGDAFVRLGNAISAVGTWGRQAAKDAPPYVFAFGYRVANERAKQSVAGMTSADCLLTFGGEADPDFAALSPTGQAAQLAWVLPLLMVLIWPRALPAWGGVEYRLSLPDAGWDAIDLPGVGDHLLNNPAMFDAVFDWLGDGDTVPAGDKAAALDRQASGFAAWRGISEVVRESLIAAGALRDKCIRCDRPWIVPYDDASDAVRVVKPVQGQRGRRAVEHKRTRQKYAGQCPGCIDAAKAEQRGADSEKKRVQRKSSNTGIEPMSE